MEAFAFGIAAALGLGAVVVAALHELRRSLHRDLRDSLAQQTAQVRQLADAVAMLQHHHVDLEQRLQALTEATRRPGGGDRPPPGGAGPVIH